MLGAHEIEVMGGSALEKHGFVLQICVSKGHAIELQCGALIPSRGPESKQTELHYKDRLFRIRDGKKNVVDDSSGRIHQLTGGLKIRIRVGQRSIEVWRGTTRSCKAVLKRKPGGSLWIQAEGIESLSIQGRIDRDWLTSLREDWLDARWRLYLRDWKAAEELPSWLLVQEDPARARHLDIPDRLTTEQKLAMAPLHRIWQARRWSALSRKLFYLDKKTLPPDTILYLQAIADHGLDRKAEASRGFEALLSKRPSFDQARIRLAAIYRRSHRSDRALALWAVAIEASPESSRPRAELARHYLLSGQRGRAKNVLADAVHAGIQSSLLRSMADTCVLMELGPTWKNRSEHRSSHFLVISDLSTAECRRATRILESAREDFLRRFPNLEVERKAPYVAYLFSNQKSFATYVSRIFSRPDIHTAGLYSSILDQLLAWKSPQKGELERTLRHEAIHQLMAGKLRTAPPWLQEGLALSYEQMDRSGREARPDKRQESLVSLLGSKLSDLPTLSTLFSLTDEAFLEEGPRNYAWSAIFVLFLHQERARSGTLNGIVAHHVRQVDPDKARAAMVDTLDLVELESRFKLFLEELLPRSK